MTTIFDPRTLITRKQVVHPLSDLDGMAIDMAALCDQLSEQIIGEEFETEREDCLREAEIIRADIVRLYDKITRFQAEYAGEVS
jgi:hypothetical protein